MSDISEFKILISGEFKSGKTTTQNNLYPELQRLLSVRNKVWVTKGNFADKLKEEASLRSGVSLGMFYTDAGKEMYVESIGMTLRAYLQTIGEAERQKNPNVWVEGLYDEIRTEARAACVERVIIVVGDCRHPNEIDASRPGLAVRLEGDPSGTRKASSTNTDHISETALRQYAHFDLTINTEENDRDAVVRLILNKLIETDPQQFGALAESSYLRPRSDSD